MWKVADVSARDGDWGLWLLLLWMGKSIDIFFLRRLLSIPLIFATLCVGSC